MPLGEPSTDVVSAISLPARSLMRLLEIVEEVPAVVVMVAIALESPT